MNISLRSGFLFGACVLFMVACSSSHHTYQPPAAVVAAPPKMIFLSFSIRRDSIGSAITLLQKQAVDGKIKGKAHTAGQLNYIVISIVGKNHLVLNTETLPHPLFRDIETTNSKGEFEHKTVTLTEAEFFVRMRLPHGSDWVLVEEFVGSKRLNSVEYPLNK